MFSSLELKVIGILAVVGMVLAINGYAIVHIYDAGKAAEEAAVAAGEQKAAAAALAKDKQWSDVIDKQGQIHAQELANINSVHFVSTPAGVPASSANSAGTAHVPAVSRTPSGPQPPYPSRGICGGVLPQTSNELQWEFTLAQRADATVADYRELYNSWPESLPESAPR